MDVGSYKASIVPSLDDFERIDRDVFTLSPKIFEFLKRLYPEGYSFLVCQLEQNRAYHPFAYQHGTLPNGRLFIPTIHFHQHEEEGEEWKQTPNFAPMFRRAGINDRHWRGREKRKMHGVDWDHHIFCWNRPLLTMPDAFDHQKTSVRKPSAQEVQSRVPCRLEELNHLYCYTVSNYHENHDLVC